jgi:NAD(P)-dependent dehydrogenase (short-subunit alcohol dehydrogenase family)
MPRPEPSAATRLDTESAGWLAALAPDRLGGAVRLHGLPLLAARQRGSAENPAQARDAVKTLSEDGPAYGITADLADREQAVRACSRRLADEHTDSTLLVSGAGVFLPKPFPRPRWRRLRFLRRTGPAIFSLTQTVARGMVAHGRGGSIVNVASVWAHQAIGTTPVIGLTGSQGRPARAHPSPGTRTRPARHPVPLENRILALTWVFPVLRRLVRIRWSGR